ncbi:hypothetical protein HBH98_130590 [Parastagonospora nodorum]|nr:hypothetical protein HBH52_121140 [Parastagonospora nodorum]KAH3984332.1 hypothetical protein HBH51_027650 [Parastagonospora nodorum]KAH4036732.1 hypothetical protein HBI09_076690 [Parastagonospora nodorum]KAH4068273.1 hypothetical protein HBH50_124820 [Parastagonospora nodorum]KAH4085491.1 hypothetical protein HBH48_150330 [Parastagonospora nodorum]
MSRRSDFSTIRPLSSGKSGGMNLEILLVKSKGSGTLYIEKRIAKKDCDKGLADRELRPMLQCQNHFNIVQYRAEDFSDYRRIGYGSIFMQYCELGDISGLIKQYTAHKSFLPDEGFLWKLTWDMSSALCHLYTGRSNDYIRQCAQSQQVVSTKYGWNRIIHRDIKPGNLFLTTKDKSQPDRYWPVVVLGDFGLSTSLKDIALGRACGKENSGGTPGFEVPEAPQFCCRSDVYQMSLTVHCLARMRQEPNMGRPFDGDHPLPRCYRDDGLRDLLKRCLRSDPANRPLPSDLPMLVWKKREAWRKSNSHSRGGVGLAKWAYG